MFGPSCCQSKHSQNNAETIVATNLNNEDLESNADVQGGDAMVTVTSTREIEEAEGMNALEARCRRLEREIIQSNTLRDMLQKDVIQKDKELARKVADIVAHRDMIDELGKKKRQELDRRQSKEAVMTELAHAAGKNADEAGSEVLATPPVVPVSPDGEKKTQAEIAEERTNRRRMSRQASRQLNAEQRSMEIGAGVSIDSGAARKMPSALPDAEGPSPADAMPSLRQSRTYLVDQAEAPQVVSQPMQVFEVGRMNNKVVFGSALGLSAVVQACIYILAMGGVIFVLIAKSSGLGEKTGSASAASTVTAAASAAHRRLDSDQASLLLTNIAFCVTGAGVLAFLINLLKQPLILGYLIGGFLVGPYGLEIVPSHEDIQNISSLGLVFLLFMVGLELDVKALLKMGPVVIFTGLLQFPTCAGLHIALLSALQAIGISWGEGDFALGYVAVTCSISSTMIVVKLLSDSADMDSPPSRLTVGILIFQDIWAIVVLAIQPDLADIQITGILYTFAMIGVLILISLFYAKYIMPAVFLMASNTVELMLVMSLAWCFYISCIAMLPFVGLGMELASLIAGVALATFPYSAEFNGKIKYIRDFFITLFFVGLGMQIPTPDIVVILKACCVVLVVLSTRWVGIFCIVRLLRGKTHLAVFATMNLSQISEFALVICSLGVGHGHVQDDTMTILIWAFAIMAIMSSYIISGKEKAYRKFSPICRRLCCIEKPLDEQAGDHAHHEEGRDIIFLGFHRIASMLLHEFEGKSPEMLKKIHVIDFNESIATALADLGVTCSYGDIGSPDVLEHAHHGKVSVCLSTIPDSLMSGVTNLQILANAKKVWPEAHIIVTADNPTQAHQLYEAGANYVLRMAKLSAERLYSLLLTHSTTTFGGELEDIFVHFQRQDDENQKQAEAVVQKIITVKKKMTKSLTGAFSER